MSTPKRTIALIGMRCVGKSVTGRALAALLGWPFLDLDEELLVDARHAGACADSAGALLEKQGEVTFRGFEASALRRVLEPCQQVVLATGGGTLESAANRGWLKRCARCVWLRADAQTIHQRMQADEKLRPALLGGDPLDEIEQLLARRSRDYECLSGFQFDAMRRDPEELAHEIVRSLRT